MDTETPMQSQFSYAYRDDPILGAMARNMRQNTNTAANPNMWGTAVIGNAALGFGNALQGAMGQIGGTLNANAERVNRQRRLETILNSPLLQSIFGAGGGGGGGGGAPRGFTTPHGQSAMLPY